MNRAKRRRYRVPPHARRSTPVENHVPRLRPGSSARTEIDHRSNWKTAGTKWFSSAHAEIDPSSCSVVDVKRWFLRSRGDRPSSSTQPSRYWPVPPHARRSTNQGGPRRTHAPGSSARAEIDPASCRTHSAVRFLRTRGDRPWVQEGMQNRLKVPPHARRSTRQSHGPQLANMGSSTLAEIDPRWRPTTSIQCWFLRTRGGRPILGRHLNAAAKVPPHAWRSTLDGSSQPDRRRGFSARAEIDPTRAMTTRRWKRFLRTRGDRPFLREVQGSSRMIPPHARRSTPRHRLR